MPLLRLGSPNRGGFGGLAGFLKGAAQSERATIDAEPLWQNDAILLDAYTLRTALSAPGLCFAPSGGVQAAALHAPHSDVPGAGNVSRDPGAAPITLGAIVRGSEVATTARRFAPLRAAFAEILFVSDGPPNSRPDGVRIIERPLVGDFAGQRNALQQAARCDWVLQLDSDERPDAELLESLGWIVRQAGAHGLLSIGFRRRNFVGGRLSDLYPDVQYRLNRRDVRYGGVVHERPDLPRGWRDSAIMLAGHIEHTLEEARVRARTKVYAAMDSDGARPEDEAALLRPFTA